MSSNLSQISSGQYQPPITNLTQSASSSTNYELYAAELGRTQQLAAQYSNSSGTYMPLMNRVEADQLQAKIRATRLAMDTGALLTNDNLLPYQLSGYEIIYLYQFQALNFIALGDISNALVAARKANDLQTYLQQQYQTQIAQAKAEAKKNNLKLDFSNNQNEQFKSTLQAAASVKSSFANAMSYYLSGILFLATNDFNDAAVSFQQAASIMPDNTYIQNMLLTTLQMQGADRSKIANFAQAFGISQLPTTPRNKAFVTVMYEQNFVNQMTAVSVPIFVPILNQIQTFAFPVYGSTSADNSPLVVNASMNGKLMPLSNTQLIVNTNALAARNLVQQYPIIFLHAALRLLTQVGVTEVAQGGPGSNGTSDAAMLTQIYFNAMSQNPDLRSWLTLPGNIQIAQYSLDPGQYEFNFSNNNLGARASQNLAANHYYLVWVTQYGTILKAQIFQL